MKKFLVNPEMFFAVFLLVGFFLTWFSQYNYVAITGYDIPETLKKLSESAFPMVDANAASLSYVLYLIPILSIVIIFKGFKDQKTKKISILTGCLPLCFFWIILVRNPFIGFERENGLYITVIAGLCTFLSAINVINFAKIE